MGVLLALAARRGAWVSRAELIDEVWNGAHVVDHAISRAVSLLRAALGEDAAAPVLVETLPRHGYRLNAAPVTNMCVDVSSARSASPGWVLDRRLIAACAIGFTIGATAVGAGVGAFAAAGGTGDRAASAEAPTSAPTVQNDKPRVAPIAPSVTGK